MKTGRIQKNILKITFYIIDCPGNLFIIKIFLCFHFDPIYDTNFGLKSLLENPNDTDYVLFFFKFDTIFYTIHRIPRIKKSR